MKFRIGIALAILICLFTVGYSEYAAKPKHPNIQGFDELVFTRSNTGGVDFGPSYTITITGDRKAKFNQRYGGEQVIFEISEAEYARIAAAINGSPFFTSSQYMCDGVSHGPSTTTLIKAKEKKRSVYGLYCSPLDHLHNTVDEVAASHHIPDAQYAIYVFNKEQDGIEWLKKAAEGGNIHAQFDLSQEYMEGKELPKDLVAAYKWKYLLLIGYKKANSRENTLPDHLTALEKQMTPDEIAEAKKQAEAWKPSR